MRIFKLVLSEQKGIIHYDGIYEKFIKAENREDAYNKSLKIITTMGSPDKDMIFWLNDNNSMWMKSLDEIEII